MFKFFDLYREYLEFNLSMRKELKNFGIKSNDIHEQLHSILFTEVKRAIRAGESVHVYSTEKLNGENAQVTWSADTNSWLIASKNVSILVTKRSDINEYRSDRFYFASQIAHSWFDLLDELDESKVDLENLKKDLTGRTLVGEYVGNSRHQHLIKYPRTMLIWFSLV